MRKRSQSKGLPQYIYKDLIDVMSKAYEASHKVIEENIRLGIPSPFSLRGRIYYLMPDGRIVLKTRFSQRKDLQ